MEKVEKLQKSTHNHKIHDLLFVLLVNLQILEYGILVLPIYIVPIFKRNV